MGALFEHCGACAATSWMLFACGCGGAGTASGEWLTEATDSFALEFVHEAGAKGRFLLPEIVGGGVALFDCDNDGDLDALLINGGPDCAVPQAARGATPNRLFENEEGGRFRDVTAGSGLEGDVYGMGVAIGDVDGDGLEDVYVTNYGPDRLYRNLGGGRFEDVTARARIDVPGWSCSAAFLDHDRDGDLDLFVTQYVAFDPKKSCFDGAGRRIYCGPKDFPPVHDVLLRNDGELSFVDVSEPAGIASGRAAGLGVVCDDFDEDGWPDIYVANDAYGNHMWINQRDGTFVDEGTLRGAAYNVHGSAEAGMGIVAEDLDGSGRTSLFVTHLRQETNTLYKRAHGQHFVDATGGSGLGAVSLALTGFGVVAFDLELDGDLDIAIANGRVKWGEPLAGTLLAPPWDAHAEPNDLFLNEGGGRFRRAEELAPELYATIEVSRGLAAGDVDGDGDVDLVATNIQGPARLYRNDAPRRGRWLIVDLVLTAAGQRALGAKLTLRSESDSMKRTIRAASGYLSSSDPRAYFGIPGGSERAELSVEWPDGQRERFEVEPLDRSIVLRRGEGTVLR